GGSPSILLHDIGRLQRAFEAAKGAVGLTRNAGVLAAELCAGLPRAAIAPDWPAVNEAFARQQRQGVRHRPDLVEEPPLSPAEFNWRIADALARWTDESLAHWLKFGTGTSPAGKPLADPVETLPSRMVKLHALARRRPRLAG